MFCQTLTKNLRSKARSHAPRVRVASLGCPKSLGPSGGWRTASSGPRAPLGSSRRAAAAAAALARPSAVSGATRGRRRRRSRSRLQMSERQAAGGPAGRGGDGPGVEGSQAAASGTQAGDRRMGPPGLGAPLVARGSAAPCPALPRAPRRSGPARASPSRAEPPPSLPQAAPRPPSPGPGLRSSLLASPVSKCRGSCPYSFLRSAQMAVAGLLCPRRLLSFSSPAVPSLAADSSPAGLAAPCSWLRTPLRTSVPAQPFRALSARVRRGSLACRRPEPGLALAPQPTGPRASPRPRSLSAGDEQQSGSREVLGSSE